MSCRFAIKKSWALLSWCIDPNWHHGITLFTEGLFKSSTDRSLTKHPVLANHLPCCHDGIISVRLNILSCSSRQSVQR